MCDASKNCVPGTQLSDCQPFAGECAPERPLGDCPEGSTCREGECFSPPEALVLQSDPTFMLKTDIFWYGFLYTTSSFSTRFNDQFNVFRPDTPSQVSAEPSAGVEMISFTDPETGISYAATQPRCGEEVSGGSVGICGACEESADCAGHFEGYYGEVFCVDDGAGGGICSQDCTDAPELCGEGYTCEEETGNCLPADGVCEEEECSPTQLNGGCEDGFTCAEGSCEEVATASPQCAISGGIDTVAVKLVRRGQSLAESYLSISEAFANASTEAEYDRFVSRYYRARYYLRNHVELLETLRATYDIFGQVY